MKIENIIVGKQYRVKLNAKEITDKIAPLFWQAVPVTLQGLATATIKSIHKNKIHDGVWWFKAEALEELVAEAPGPLLEDNPQHIIDRQTFVSMLRHKGIKLRNA
jgi:hypothetical protein